jgi:predicted transcriptional regulator of viral defense system
MFNVYSLYLRTMTRYALKPLDERLATGKSTLSSRELREELGISPQAASNLLARWRRAGLVDRVSRGHYAIRQIGLLGTSAAAEEVALGVAALVGGEPHRIAFGSALDFHGLLVRPLRTVQIAAPRRLGAASISGRPLQMIFEPSETVGIGAEAAGHDALVSGLERSLLEAAARPELVGGYQVLAEALAAADPNASRLAALAGELGTSAALRRIGSLADRLELEGLAGKLGSGEQAASFDLDLDPGQKELGVFRDREWRVRWPIEPGALAVELSN